MQGMTGVMIEYESNQDGLWRAKKKIREKGNLRSEKIRNFNFGRNVPAFRAEREFLSMFAIQNHFNFE
jgi:hypothetical protein